MYNILVGKPERGNPLGILMCTWEDNIKMDLKVIRVKIWIGFA
jgi:hypothetical protein